ncbi:MAG: hypothetical protein JOZ69_17860 [Myxococcales bacterium]|nr:hypothetical protein [Myxococcales bacterium]
MTSTALAKHETDLHSEVRLEQLWLATQNRAWRSLAVISAGSRVHTIDTANLLAKMAWRYSGQATSVFDLRDVRLRLVEHQLREITAQVAAGDRVFIALRSVIENPAAAAVARAADAAVLCVEIGTTEVDTAKKTIEAIGRERFLGCILVSSLSPASPVE